MDVFSTLPPELMAPILSDLPDLKSLYSITVSSPYVFHFMGSTLGANVLESVLDHPVSKDFTSTPWIPYMLRLVALARQTTPSNQPANDLGSFIAKYFLSNQGLGIPDLQCENIPLIRLGDVMRAEASCFSPREMIFLARRIGSLAGSCFEFFHDRIKSATPSHLLDKVFQPTPLPWSQRPDGLPWGQPYTIDAGGEASWYEMQRITLGFWSLQLSYELSNAASEGRLNWTDSDVAAIRNMGSGTCLGNFGKSNIWVAQEPLWAALIYIRHLEGVSDGCPCAGDTSGIHNEMSAFFNTGFRPLGDSHLSLPRLINAEGVRPAWPSPTPPPPHFPCIDKRDASTYHRHKVLVGCKGLRWAQPLLFPRGQARVSRGLMFGPFRALGFGLWDDERLIAMEMIDDPTGQKPKRFEVWCQDQVYTWMSLLSQTQMEELVTHQDLVGERPPRV
ncbi:hypothetical protein FALCPG4_016518 [Fusarium falciforme]